MSEPRAGIKQAICRSDMPKGQVTLLKYLYRNQKPVSTEELADEIRGGDVNSCTSILGPFSRRINNTDQMSGNPGYRAVINKKKNDGQTYYELREKARKAIDDIPRLLDEFEREMGELREETNPVIEQEEFEK